MRLVRVIVAASLLLGGSLASAQPDDDDDEDQSADDEDEDENEKPKKASKKKAPVEDDEADDEGEPAEEEEESEPKPKKKSKDDDDDGGEFKKQDLRGHAVDAEKISTPFQKDRFFVDKVDSKKTEKGTLVQGSLASSSFAYRESGGAYGEDEGNSGSRLSRYFTDLRLQTDFRHIGGGKWEARIDGRSRFVNSPDPAPRMFGSAGSDVNVQSGFLGKNEYEVREAWIVRSGKRSDVFLGRQFVTDLAAVKFDGMRIDYASSEQLTLLTFGGLFPIRG